MSEEIISNGFSQTQKSGEDFAKQLFSGDVVVLSGDLGAGKTTFVQGLARGLGIKKRLISPTFVIIRSYQLTGTQEKRFFHVDLYRLRGEEDIENTGLPDILNRKNSIAAIEWPEKMGKFLPEKRWEVSFKFLEGNKRKILIKKIK